jgi:CBS domain-containing protein
MAIITVSITVFLPPIVGDLCLPYSKNVEHASAITQFCKYSCYDYSIPCFERICLPENIRDKYKSDNVAFYNDAYYQCKKDSKLKLSFPEVDLTALASVYKPPSRFVYDSTNSCYYQYASLFLRSPDDVLRNLLSRGVYDMFDERTLILFFIVYMVVAGLTYNTMLPTDPVLPNLIIGAAAGRLFGLYVNSIKASLGHIPVDPGVYAILGAGGFWAGTSRICITIAIIMTESSLDISYLFAMLVVVVIATISGNWFGHSQYHEEIHVKGLPFLGAETPDILRHKKVHDIMTPLAKLVTFEEKEVVWSVFHKLKKTHYSGFPVVSGKKVVGFLQRFQIKHVIRFLNSLSEQEKKLLDGTSSKFSQHELKSFKTDESMHMLDRFESFKETEKMSLDKNTHVVDIKNVMSKPVFTVYETMSAYKAYGIFRRLGLRSMCIINADGYFVGLVTREDLLNASHEHGHH